MRYSLCVPFMMLSGHGMQGQPLQDLTNKAYKKQARQYGREISQSPLPAGADSVPTPDWWVGTTNFNLRKPNFVIIHPHRPKQLPPDPSDLHPDPHPGQRTLCHLPRRRGPAYAQRLPAGMAGFGVSKNWGNITDLNLDLHRHRTGQRWGRALSRYPDQ